MPVRRPLLALVAALAVAAGTFTAGAPTLAAPVGGGSSGGIPSAPSGYVPPPVTWTDCSAD